MSSKTKISHKMESHTKPEFKITEEVEEILLSQIKTSLSEAEDYLDEIVRPNIEENMGYYNKLLPKPDASGASFVDNTVQATVDHYVAVAMDAFTSDDTLEVIPESNDSPIVRKIINSVITDVIDSENSRHILYKTFFKDGFISSAALMKPYVDETRKVRKEFFQNITKEELAMRVANYEIDDEWEEVDYIISETTETSIEHTSTVPTLAGLQLSEDIDLQTNIKSTQELVSGYFDLAKTEKTIKIDNIPAENFIINKSAKSLYDASICGDKSLTTISDLLNMDFEYDKVLEVYQSVNSDDDSYENVATQSRKDGYQDESTSVDNSQQEVELYELYMLSSVKETANKENKFAVSKLYKIYYADGIILECNEVDSHPYVGCSPIMMPMSFWGKGIADITKDIQKAKTGNWRQHLLHNTLVNTPKFTYIPELIINTRDLFSTKAGAGIAVKDHGAVQPVQMGVLSGDSAGIDALLDRQRETGTGISLTGQGLMGEVFKSGASTIAGSMVLSENQLVQKDVIKNLLELGIKPLIKVIYNLLRDNFDSWETTVNETLISINPNAEWPRLREVKIVTPLGSSAKLEKANKYMDLFNVLSASTNAEVTKLMTPETGRNLLVEAYENMGISDVNGFMATKEEVVQKDQTMQMMQQMQQQMSDMQTQLQQAITMNQQLQGQLSNMEQAKISIMEREVAIKEHDSEVKGQLSADEQALKEDKAKMDAEYKADKLALDEYEARAEVANPDVSFVG